MRLCCKVINCLDLQPDAIIRNEVILSENSTRSVRALHAKTKHVRLYTYRAVKIEDKIEWVKASSKLQTDIGKHFELPKDR